MNFLLDGNNMKYVRILTISGILVACLLGCAVRRSDGVHDSEKSQERNELVWLTARTDAKITATTTVVDGGEIFGYTGRITILASPPIRTGTIPLKMKDGQKVVSRNLKMKSPIYRKIRKRTRTVRLKRIGRQAMRKQRIRIWILKPERSRSGGG